MARSVVIPVGCRLPAVCSTSMLPNCTPRPTCCGLVPPRVPMGAVAARIVSYSMSLKVTRLALNPTVLTLAMLLPMTSMRVWWVKSPETPENSDRIMVPQSSPALLRGPVGPHLHHVQHRKLPLPHHQPRLAAPHPHRIHPPRDHPPGFRVQDHHGAAQEAHR